MNDVLDAEDLIRELSPTVGEDMARKSVRAALADVGLEANRALTPAQRDAALASLGRQPGLVGLAATVLGHRLRLTHPEGRRDSSPEVPKVPAVPPVQPRPAKAQRADPAHEDVPVSLIVAHMASTIGLEKAEDLVGKTTARIGLGGTSVLRWEACERVTDLMAKEPGVVGLAAKVTRQKLRMRMAPIPNR